VVAAACLTRYFALFWLLPIGAVLVAAGSGRPQQRARRVAVFAGLSVAPVALWMWMTHLETGYWTGMDRFAPRGFLLPTALTDNLVHTGRSLFLDLISPRSAASHVAVVRDWNISGPEWVLGLVAALLVLGCAAVATRLALRSNAGRPEPRRVLSPQAALLVAFPLGYLVALIVLWSVANNDPIHTRFVYPVYVFLLLSGFHVYSRVLARSETSEHWARLPFYALYFLLVALQAVETLAPLAGT
jgi:hypothetical protein